MRFRARRASHMRFGMRLGMARIGDPEIDYLKRNFILGRLGRLGTESKVSS
jgi:hypothetical protein